MVYIYIILFVIKCDKIMSNKIIKALLVNPPFPVKDGVSHLPLPLAYIGALYLKKGVNVKALDFAIEEDWQLNSLKRYKNFEPDLVIIHCYLAKHFYYSSFTAKKIKKMWPNALVVITGMHPTFASKEILIRHKDFDVVILYEPEMQAVELIDYLKGNKKIKDIKGITYRNKNKIVKNSLMPLTSDLDFLPFPARKLFPIGKYYKKDFETTLRAGRGCVFNCIFCLQNKMARRLRERKAESVVKELQEVYNLGFKSVFFEDENFTLNKKRVLDICEEIISKKIKIRWSCNSRISDYENNRDTLKMLEFMKKSGCYRIFCGIESNNNICLGAINKRIKIEQIKKNIKLVQSFGIEIHGSFIVGLPGMNREDHKKLADYAKSLRLDMVSFNIMTPYPGTELCSEANKLGIIIPDRYWYEKKDWYNHPIAGTKEIPPKKMNNVLREVYMNYFS